MQDKITIADAPDCLNTNDKAMWVLGYQAALEARSTCLHQIQEPAAAEQAAWHAGLDEGRAQAGFTVSNEETSQTAPAAVAVHMAEAWELSAADTEQRTTGAGQDYNQGVAEGLRICAKDLRAALAVTPAADEPMVNMTPPATRRDRWMYEQGRLAERDARTHGNAAAAAPVVLPEPEAYLFQHEDTGQTMFVEAQQVEWGFEANNPRLQKISGVYTEQQVRALLATATGLPAQAVETTPVAWRYQTPTGWHATTDAEAANRVRAHHTVEPLYAAPPAQADARDALTPAARDVLAERQRQITQEGYDPQHDDDHVNDEIAAMAALFIMPEGAREWDATSTSYGDSLAEAILPRDWEMPNFGDDRRRQLVKGTAMGLAEIERIDRAAIAAAKGE